VSDHPDKAKEVFLDALDVGPTGDRAAFLDAACGGDPALRAEVEGLLAHHPRVGAFLATAVRDPDATAAHVEAADGPGTVVGAYRLMEQIGEGGFGLVFVAEQTHPVRRQVALKVIKPGMDTREVVARFEVERQALALMDHPNIARVFDAGATPAGRPFFVMELVRGSAVTQYCDAHQLAPRDRLGLFVDLCGAVQHAHQKGVIHRDIKPSNVLVASYDGTPVVKVIDFGIAKAVGPALTDKTVYTRFAQMVGTPLYMSPEQAGSSGLDVDTRTDIYALGVLLYELLTGTTPFDRGRFKGAGYEEIRRIIVEEEPSRPSTRVSTLGLAATTASANRRTDPRRLTALIRGDLDWIVMKALEKERGRRYETAGAFAADVRRYLADEPVLARPPSAAYRFRKFARRNTRGLVTAAALAVVVAGTVVGLAATTLIVSGQKRATETALRAETDARAEATRNFGRERREAYYHRIALADRELSSDNLGRATELLDACPPDLRGWEWHHLVRACRVEPLVLDNPPQANSLAFSRDGSRLAVAGGGGVVTVRDGRTGAVLTTLPGTHAGYVSSVAFHPAGGHLATVGADKAARVWDLGTGAAVFTRPCDSVHYQGAAHAVEFQPPDGRALAVANAGVVDLWDWRADGRTPAASFAGHERLPICLAFTADGRTLATGSWRGAVRLWEAAAGGRLVTVPGTGGNRHPVSAVTFTADGGRLAAASFERRVDVWDAAGVLLHSLPHSGLVLCAAFSPDGRRLATGGEDKSVRVWDADTGREVLVLRGHTGACACVAFSPDGRRLAAAAKDGRVRVWDATPLPADERQELDTYPQPGEVWSLAVEAGGGRVVSGGFNAAPTVWDAATGRAARTFAGHRDVVFSVAWDRGGGRVVTTGAEGAAFTTKVWDARTGADLVTLAHGPEYFCAAFSPDGRHVVTGRMNGTVEVWDAGTGAFVRTVGTRPGVIRGVVFSPDGRHLASVGGDGFVQQWDATDLARGRPPRHGIQARIHGPCLNIAFTPDGRRLATGGPDNTVKVWDVDTAAELLTLRGHSGDVYTVAFSPDGRWVASAGEDSAVKVWDARTGGLVRSLRGHTRLVCSLAFRSGPDGLRLYSGGRDRTVKVWDVSRPDGPAGR
jgi:WD40 repeat protein/serine/threonine protein kinase